MNARELVERTTGLCSPPEVCVRVSSLLDDPSTTESELAQVIGHDPVLTARLLRMANHLPCGEPLRVHNVYDAVARIGLSGVRAAVTATSAVQAFEHVDVGLVDMADFWHHSVCCGLAARSLSRRCEVQDPECLFVAGLLHDLGQLVIYHTCPDLAVRVLMKAGESEYHRYRAEQEIIGITHAEVGAELMHQWQMPPDLQQIVEFHHEPSGATEFALHTSIVHIATAIANGVEPSWKTSRRGQDSATGISASAWQVTGLSSEIIPATVAEINMESFAVMALVAPESLLVY